jgi:hypothetical protein
MRGATGRRLSYANVTATLALFIALGGGAYAAAGSPFVGSSGAISGCVKTKGGPLTIVKAGRKCPKGTVSLVLNTKGATGPQGATGATGAAGATGTGTKGEQGPPGPSGISDYQKVESSFKKSSGGSTNVGGATAECPAGTSLLGGGYNTTEENLKIFMSENGPTDSGEGWEAVALSGSSATFEVKAYAFCAKVAA